MELTLLRFIQLVFRESLEHQPHLLEGPVQCPGEYQYIIQIDKHKMVEQVAENVIDKYLKHSWNERD